MAMLQLLTRNEINFTLIQFDFAEVDKLLVADVTLAMIKRLAHVVTETVIVNCLKNGSQ